MNTKRKCSLIVAATFAFATTGAGQPEKSFLSVQDILSAWQGNYGALKSMKVSYFEKIVSATPSPADPNIVRTFLKWNYVERVEQGSKFRVRYSATEEGFADIEGVGEMSFDGIHQRLYYPAQKEGSIYAGVAKEHTNILKRYLLSEPYLERPRVESKDSIFSKTVSRGLTNPNLTISVRPVLEEISGQMCHVLELVKKGEKQIKADIIWVAHEKGMLPIKRQEFDSKGAITLEMEVEQIAFTKTKDGGLWYPKKAFRVINLPEYIGVVKYEFEVFNFVPNIMVDPNTFQLDFPNGTHVFDTESAVDYIAGVE
jgi:hypothetical protein